MAFSNELKMGGVDKITMTPLTINANGSVTEGTPIVLNSIVADTTSITQDDPTTNAIECETSDDPIYENITLGKYQISMESGDINKEILVNFFGFTVGSDSKSVYAPDKYKTAWAKLELEFEGEGKLICPKVKLSSKVDASSLKTGMVRGVITGTCYAVSVTDITGTNAKTPFYVTDAAATAGA